MKPLFNDPSYKKTRQRLRNQLTPPEKRLWYYVRNRQINGYKFRRQVGVGAYIVDFLSYEAKIIIEVDGDSHFESIEAEKYDLRRTQFLESQGFSVIRFTNTEAMTNTKACVEALLAFIITPDLTPSHSP